MLQESQKVEDFIRSLVDKRAQIPSFFFIYLFFFLKDLKSMKSLILALLA